MTVWEPTPNGNATTLQGVPVSNTPPTDGQELVYVAATGLWTPSSEAPSSGVISFATRTGAVVPLAADYAADYDALGAAATAQANAEAASIPASTGTTIGDLIVATGAGTYTRIAGGTTGQVLTGVTGSEPTWQASGSAPVSSVFGRTGVVVAATNDYTPAQVGAIPASTGTTIGDLIVATGASTYTRIAVGATAGTVLTSNGTGSQPTWQVSGSAPVSSVFGRTGVVVAATNDYTPAQVGAIPASTGTTIGDLIVATGAGTYTRIAGGTTGQVLTGVTGSEAVWSNPAVTPPDVGTTAGDLIVATGAGTYARLADVAVGQVLKSGGVGVAPSWGTSIDVPLSTVTTAGDLIVGTGASTVGRLAAVAAGSVLSSNGIGATPIWAVPSAGALTKVSGVLGGDVLLVTSTDTLIITTASVAIGRWHISAHLNIDGSTTGGGNYTCGITCVVGTAVASSFEGPTTADTTGNSTISINQTTSAIDFFVNITTAGTLQLRAKSNATPTIRANGLTYTTAPASGYVGEKIG